MKRWVVRIVVILALAEIAYLVVGNVILNLPGTQAALNRLRPERIAYRWDRAWTWYPFRVELTGFSVNGQSWSQQWEFSAPEISGSLALLPLFSRTLHFSAIETADIAVRFRPRPSPDRDDADLRPYYPTIPGRDPDLPAEPVPVESPGWLTVFDIAGIGGTNDLWLGATRATLNGEASAYVVRQNLHGPLSIRDGSADLAIASLAIAGRNVLTGGAIRGSFGFAPFLPQENRRLDLLRFLSLDAAVDLPIESIDFLDFILATVADLKVSGRGSVKGRVVFDRGHLAPGADVTIAADSVSVELPPYAVRGAGTVTAKVEPADPGTVAAAFRFTDVSGFLEPDGGTLFSGSGVAIDVLRSVRVLPGDGAELVPRRVVVTVPAVSVPDIAVYQRYLPDKWDIAIAGGTGRLAGHADLGGGAFDFDLVLGSDDAEIRYIGNSFESGVELAFKAKGKADDKTASIDFSGSHLDLDDSRLSAGARGASDPWHTRLDIAEGIMEIALPGADDADSGIVGFWRVFRSEDLKRLLASLDGKMRATLSVSDLDWVTLLFRNPFSLSISDAAALDIDLSFDGGWLAEGSRLSLPARGFAVSILDYVATGKGGFDLAVTKGGEKPDLRLDASLAGASLRLADEKTAVVDQVAMTVAATAEGVALKEGGTLKSVEMSIPSAKITDMAAYNAYLPEASPVRILGGTADLSAKLVMEGESAGGFVKMKTSRIEADLVGDRISGVVSLDVAIEGGSAKGRSFDISGSSLALDEVSVSGAHATGGWSARADFGKAHVDWKRPMSLDLDATFTMTDAQPVLAVFAADRKTNRWLDRLLDLRNIRGQATIKVTPDEAVVPYAFARSDTIDVGAKGIFRVGDRQGVFYARSGGLAGLLAIDGDQKKFELIEATRKFDDYVPGGPLPGLADGRGR
jgi:hypothetical protein